MKIHFVDTEIVFFKVFLRKIISTISNSSYTSQIHCRNALRLDPVDMNARIADRDDFVLLDVSTHIDVFPDDYTCDISLPCATQDRGINANGTLLLDFCKRSGFRIVNSRIVEDSEFRKCGFTRLKFN